MTFRVDQFRSQLASDGARPNLFEATLNFPAWVGAAGLASRKSNFMCKTAQLPGSTINAVTIPYFGREVKVAGNRTFADWSVTIINDEDFIIRNALERWHRGINENITNLRKAEADTTVTALDISLGYAADLTVTQYSKFGGALRTYTFVGAWPSDIAAIDLDWGSNDTIEEYSVTFSYQYWKSGDGNTDYPEVSGTRALSELAPGNL